MQSLVEMLNRFSTQKFTGKINLHGTSGRLTTIYWQSGRMLWASGGTHPNRRLRRYLSLLGFKVDANGISLRPTDSGHELPEYLLMTVLVRRNAITREQAITVIEGVIGEALFDLVQQAIAAPIYHKTESRNVIDTPMTLMSVPATLDRVMKFWRDWQRHELVDISPNFAPVLQNLPQLQESCPPQAYKALTTLIDGKHTLYELAAKLKRDLLQLTQSLLTYFHRGHLQFVELSDAAVVVRIPEGSRAPDPRPDVPTQPKVKRPLIACVDDNVQAAKILEQVVSRLGYGYVAITDSLQVLPKLIEHKPDLIFLDVVMPIVNGYEICTQIRRVPAFKATPIIFLTSNDGFVDRVKANLAGASNFLSKSASSDKVSEMLKRYIVT
ncbi:MAG: response regulator [Oscillatoriales cyanobacterium SM2_2_1]|nr:response regulator [Oscillatoriales cyanobacterium SM2_2_1]